MQTSTKTIILIVCSVIGLILIFAAALAGWLVFSAVESVNNNLTGGYKISGGKVYYYKKASGLTPWQSSEVSGADPGSLTVIDDQYATDKDGAYFEGESITQSSSHNFKVIRTPYASDGDHVFYKQRSFSDAPDRFRIIEDDDALSTDGVNIYSGADALFPGTIDPATFEHIGDTNYFRDKNLVLTLDKIIEGADPVTFEVIPEYKGIYAKDKKSVFYDGMKVPGCDPATHQIIDYKMHRDARQVFFGAAKFNDNAATFKALDCNFAKDDKNVYWKLTLVEGANAAKFKVLHCDGYGVGFGSDGKNAFWCTLKFDRADPATLVGLSGHYAKDKNNVWYAYNPDELPQIVENADPSSFELTVIAADEGQDKNNEFDHGEISRPRH